MSSTLRTRWAAIGAAVAISLGAGGFGLARATSPSGAAAFVPITPCRVFDTRPAFNVGAKSSPLGPGETYTVTGTGTAGDCTTVPATATGLVINLTAVNPGQATFLTVWGDGARPTASSLNPTPGQPPTPNAVTTDLTATGRFNVYNLAGNVHAFADIVGYYTDHDHDDRYYTKAQTDAAIANQAWSVVLAASGFHVVDTTATWPNMSVSDWSALAYADSFGRAFYGLTLPSSYTPGASLRVDVDWRPIEIGFGALTAPCQIVLWAETVAAARVGSEPFYRSAVFDVAHPSVSGATRLQVTTQMVADDTVQRASFTINGAGLQPGDRLNGVLTRRGADGDDTCTGGLAVFGATITES